LIKILHAEVTSDGQPSAPAKEPPAKPESNSNANRRV
jgi:hypothetical protein